jgi:hypothetical protein
MAVFSASSHFHAIYFHLVVEMIERGPSFYPATRHELLSGYRHPYVDLLATC